MDEKKWEEILLDIDELERRYFPDRWLEGGVKIVREKEQAEPSGVKKLSLDEKERELREKERALFEQHKEFLEKRFADKSNDYESVKSELIQANQFLSKEIERYHREVETLRNYLFEERKNIQNMIGQKMSQISEATKEFGEISQFMKNFPKVIEDIKKAQPTISPEEITKIRESERMNARIEIAKAKEALEKKIQELTAQIEDRAQSPASSGFNIDKSRLMYYDDVTRGFVHRIKNFLGIIEGSAQYVLANMKLDDELKEQITSIDEGSRELEKSVNEFSLIGRIPDFAPAMKNITPLIKAAIDELNPKIKEKKAAVLVELPAEISLLIDEKLTQETFSAVLTNAVEAVKADGKISVQYELNTQDKIHIFKIGDNGVGVSESHIGKIFQPFFTNKKNWKGMGLTYAKRNMLLHHGDILIESQKDKGTLVRIIFPK